jgi:signal peptidase I
VSDHWDWNRPELDDEDEKEESVPEPESPGGWPKEPEPADSGSEDPGGGPTSGSTWQQSGYGGYGEAPREWDRPSYGDYGYTSHEDSATDEPTGEWPSHRSRDPLARLFPGLPRSVRVTLDWILTIAGAILIVFALKLWVVNPYRIPSSSMEPTLNCAKGPAAVGCLGDSSDRVLACRICLDFRSPSRNDIVVFNTPRDAAIKCGEGGTFVKRVIGLPGDTVREDDFGNIWIRGPNDKKFVKLKEPYLTSQRRLADSAHFGQTWHVPEGQYFMMGDNRSQSCDSRTWGSVPRNKLIGIVFFIYWPPDRISFR